MCKRNIKRYSKKEKRLLLPVTTVPVGSGDESEKILKKEKTFTVISNPEFLREE